MKKCTPKRKKQRLLRVTFLSCIFARAFHTPPHTDSDTNGVHGASRIWILTLSCPPFKLRVPRVITRSQSMKFCAYVARRCLLSLNIFSFEINVVIIISSDYTHYLFVCTCFVVRKVVSIQDPSADSEFNPTPAKGELPALVGKPKVHCFHCWSLTWVMT